MSHLTTLLVGALSRERFAKLSLWRVHRVLKLSCDDLFLLSFLFINLSIDFFLPWAPFGRAPAVNLFVSLSIWTRPRALSFCVCPKYPCARLSSSAKLRKVRQEQNSLIMRFLSVRLCAHLSSCGLLIRGTFWGRAKNI